MRLCKYAALAVVAVGLGVGAVGVPAWADAPGMQWKSPAKITTGVPFRVVSIAKCPAAPTPGDTVLVQVTLSLGAGGSANDVAPARSDGSWSATMTFSFSAVNLRHTTISAACVDFNGHTGVPYARYRARNTQIFD
jgi:hypothetical protein